MSTFFRASVNGQAGISPEMAIRLSKAFGTTPDICIRMQAACGIAQAKGREDQIKVERYEPRPAA